ncbi:MAG: NAD(+)/NADH kinase [Lachnospiraceae bacterium]|nr:NAD(+)/NADH kinase [Lachnospiraceae bacterium]
MNHFCIYTNVHKDKDLFFTEKVRSFLIQQNKRCSIKASEEEEIPQDVDCILVLGGDGTMLQAARDIMERKGVALLGINLGTLGYLTEVEPEGVENALLQLFHGDYELESRMMLKGMVIKKEGGREEGWALNDIVISKADSQKVLEFTVSVNGKLLNRYLADGMIVTTPTGSTGYNLSAGGPIAEPGARLLILTPICPHTINQRSIILSPEDEIVIDIPLGREGQTQRAAARFDGCALSLQTGDAIRIVKSEKTTDFIKLSKAGFLEVLRKKMSDN